MDFIGLGLNIRAKDILRKCELLSLAFNGFTENDETALKKLMIYNYRRNKESIIEFPAAYMLGFRAIYKYNNLIDDRMYSSPLDGSFSESILNNNSAFQIFIGKYDEKYVFIDMENEIFFFVEERFLKSYIGELLIKTNHTLFDVDFKNIENKLVNTDLTNYTCFNIEMDDRVVTHS